MMKAERNEEGRKTELKNREKMELQERWEEKL